MGDVGHLIMYRVEFSESAVKDLKKLDKHIKLNESSKKPTFPWQKEHEPTIEQKPIKRVRQRQLDDDFEL